ncbi:MAG TPA: hypothetical protein VK892_21160 [Pyrinomonadaceae bacterium]|nr:hypothetical protein [Pyrinomonadaceae bacterium]
MKSRFVLTAIFALFAMALAVSAQEKTTNFAGNWELDAGKSKLPEQMRIESMTLNVSQTDKELKVESKTKRAAPPEGSGGGMGRGGGRGGFGGGDGTVSYSLDGKETKIQRESPMGQIPVTLKAKFEKDGKLKLTSTAKMNTQMGEVTVTTKENWELLDEGKTLKITRDMETPRGTTSAVLVFTKKSN